MKIIWTALAFLAVVSLVYCSEDSDEVFEKVKSKHIKSLLKNRKETVDEGLSKLEERCPGVGEKLKKAITNFAECNEGIDDSLTICKAIQTYALNCTQPLLTVIDECLPQKARGLPSLGFKSILSVADYLCKLDGESMFELMNPCLYEDDESSQEEDECEKKVLTKLDQYKNEPPSPSDICSVATDLRSCVKTHTTQSCKNEKTRTVAMGLYDALTSPCSTINQVN